ncbi:ribosome biogenesis GTPase Der [bacterium]|nr:ribosome biogenesis GTPase Der [bacterium]
MIKVAIIGRPNVGKSTLFNKLVKKNVAIVYDTAGTTRDVKEYVVKVSENFMFTLLDTAGLEKADKNSIAGRMTSKTIEAIKSADFILFMIDAKASVLPEDIYFANVVKKHNKPVILIANKAENINNFRNNLGEFYKLGFGDALPLSAEHGQGIISLIDKLESQIKKIESDNIVDTEEEGLNDDELKDIIEIVESSQDETPIDLSVRISIIGRPNVGKSTLVNTLLGEERVLVGDEAGITRDSIDTDFVYRGRDVKLIDTAGLRKRSKVYEGLEKLSTARSIEAIKNSDVCIIVIDASLGLDKQDLIIANVAVNEGKGLIFVLNKWDLIKDKKYTLTQIKDKLEESFAQVKNIPLVCVSALKSVGVKEMMKEAFEVYDLRNLRISTGKLNKWLERVVIKNPPPLSRLKRPMSIKYITQSAVKPPTFTLFVGGASILPDNYKRYLINSLGEEFGFDKIVIRLKTRTSKNPYKDKK